MSVEQFDFSKKFTKKMLDRFADLLMRMQQSIDFRVSSRGWCYLMEQAGYIDKSQFDKVDNAINRCRREGMIPVNFVAEEAARQFSNVEEATTGSVDETIKLLLKGVLKGSHYYTPDWWEGEKYYIQMLVEKIDLKTLFEPVCAEYHIPIANAKGWSSILQRAEYARRFKEAEDKGLTCVLLYCGDHDPDGLRISDTIRQNLYQIQDIVWEDGEKGYDPTRLKIHRFGLNYDFIQKNGYTWIDNLITGSGGELAIELPDGSFVPGQTKAGNQHKNFDLPYLQEYLQTIGVRKCEANAIVTTPDSAREFVRDEIEIWIGTEALNRFQVKREAVRIEYEKQLLNSGLHAVLSKYVNDEKEEEEDDFTD